MSAVQSLTTQNFDEIIQSQPIVVVDFWAQWCSPCRVFGETMAEVAKHYPDVLFASVNVETEKELAEEFAVRSIPFVMVIHNQTVVYAESGVLSVQGLSELIDQARALK